MASLADASAKDRPDEESRYKEWFALWRLTDLELWPDIPGRDACDIRAMTRQKGTAHEHQIIAATDDLGSMVGIGMLDLPQRDNRHSMGIDIRVHPEHRRRGAGRTIVNDAVRWAREDGRTKLSSFLEVPTAIGATCNFRLNRSSWLV
jgi:GNAT superfamily N-acetyltransferase